MGEIALIRATTRLVGKLHHRLGIPKAFSGHVGWIALANSVNNGTIFVANLVVARGCGPELFGQYSLAVTITLLALTISEFGMNYTMVRLYKHYLEDQAKRLSIVWANFYFKALMLLSLWVAGIVGGEFLAGLFLHDSGRYRLVTIALACGGILGFWSFLKAFFQATGAYRAIAEHTAIYAAFRMLFLVSLILFVPTGASAELLLVVVYIFPLTVVLWRGFTLLRYHGAPFHLPSKLMLASGRESLRYSVWVALTGISFVLIQQSFILIVSAFGGVKQVALLNAGLVFTAAFAMINDAINQVLYSKVVGLPLGRITEYRRRLMRLAPIFLGGVLVLMGLLSAIMIFALGDRYAQSLPVFWITGLGGAVTAFIGYFSMVMHTIKQPKIGAYVNAGSLLCFIVCAIPLMRYDSLLLVAAAYVLVLIGGELAKASLIGRHLGEAVRGGPA